MWCLVWVRVLCWIKAVSLAPCPTLQRPGCPVRLRISLARAPLFSASSELQRSSSVMWQKAHMCKSAHPPHTSFHFSGHWAHLWIHVSHSEQLGHILTKILAPQLFLASCISCYICNWFEYLCVFTIKAGMFGVWVCVADVTTSCRVSDSAGHAALYVN